jgi:hypothetical protein
LKYCQIPHKFKFLLRPIVHFLWVFSFFYEMND